jgi:hypothetical protein
MPWTIAKPAEPGSSTLILDTEGQDHRRLAGSILWTRRPAGYRVEIMWSGPYGDIVFEAPSFEQAEAFARGVEVTMNRVFGPDVWGRIKGQD